MKPGVNNIASSTKNVDLEIPITVHGEQFFITIIFKSLSGGIEFAIPKEQFSKLVFDNSYKSPWITGVLQFTQVSDIQKDTVAAIEQVLAAGNYGSHYSGQILKIVVEKQSLSTRCQRIALIDQLFFVTHIELESKNSKVLNYYFAHIDVSTLMFAKFPWSTNDALINKLATPSTQGGFQAASDSRYPNLDSESPGPMGFDPADATRAEVTSLTDRGPIGQGKIGAHFNASFKDPTKVPTSIPRQQAEKIVSHLSSGQKQVFVSDAIQQLLNHFCSKDEFDIINEFKWDKSKTKIEFSLAQGDRPLDGLFYLMSQYVSEDQLDMGLLRVHGGQYSLTSLTNLIKDSGRLSDPRSSGGIQFKQNFGGVIEVQTDDTRPKYSKRQADSLWDRYFLATIVRKEQIKEHPKQPKDGAKYIIDHSISSYNFTNGVFNLYNEEGSIANLKNNFKQTMQQGFTDSDKKELNANKDELTAGNKQIISQTATGYGDPGGQYLGKTTLQQKILDKSNKITINMMGNLTMSAGKFIGIHMPGRHMKPTLPGIWFVLNNTTTLTQNSFRTKLTCSQIDANAPADRFTI